MTYKSLNLDNVLLTKIFNLKLFYYKIVYEHLINNFRNLVFTCNIDYLKFHVAPRGPWNSRNPHGSIFNAYETPGVSDL